MKLLLDTHILLWTIVEPERIAEPTRNALSDQGNTLWFSAVSLWEICIKAGAGKLDLLESWPAIMEKALEGNNIRWLGLEQRHCLKLLELPNHHRDPFDRMLVAQAQCEQMVLVTTDRNIRRYPVEVL